MGSVLPRENSGVESVPWSRLTRSAGFRVDSAELGATCGSAMDGLACASPGMAAARVARLVAFRKLRRLGRIFLDDTAVWTLFLILLRQLRSGALEEESVPQGLKPIPFDWLFGTTEVVPCYKAQKL